MMTEAFCRDGLNQFGTTQIEYLLGDRGQNAFQKLLEEANSYGPPPTDTD